MKKTVLLLLASLLVLVGVITINTINFSKDLEPRLVDKVQVQLDERAAIQRFAKSLTFPSISYTDPALFPTGDFVALRQYLSESFPRVFAQLETEDVSEFSYLMKWPGSNPQLKPILLLSHMDVVPVIPGTENEWTHPPFGGVVASGAVWGRGAIDDKAGVLGILEATETLLAQGFAPSRTVYLAFGHDEEVGGQQGAKKIADLLQTRGVTLEFVLDEGGLITDGVVDGIDAPVAVIGPGEKGILSLRLIAAGPGGHSSQPLEYTAAGLVARAVYRLEENPFPIDLSYLSQFIHNLGSELPLLQRVVFANTWLFEPFAHRMFSGNSVALASARTTTAPTMLKASIKENVLPIQAEAVVNFRILPGDSVQGVIDRVKTIIDDDSIEIERYGFWSEPSEMASTESFGYEQLSLSIAQVIPNKDIVIVPRLVIGATDARHFSQISENSYRFMGITVGKEELKGFHGTNERVPEDSYINAVKIYLQLIRNAAG